MSLQGMIGFDLKGRKRVNILFFSRKRLGGLQTAIQTRTLHL